MGRSWAPCIGSIESEPLDHQRIPNSLGSFFFFFFFLHRLDSFLLKKFSEQSEFQKHICLIFTELTIWHILPAETLLSPFLALWSFRLTYKVVTEMLAIKKCKTFAFHYCEFSYQVILLV